jgi:tripartite-type tricarboxylate transporter receptor subunit TctC
MQDLSRRSALISLTATAASLALAPTASWAQAWPNKPIRIIVPFPPGGATDTSARLLAEHLTRRLGQSVIVENKPGASTIIGLEAAAKAAPDGNTLLIAGVGSFSVLPATRANLPFNVDRDFAPISMTVSTPIVLVTPSTRPFRSLADFIAAAKAQPSGLRYSTYGPGSAPHLVGEMMAAAAGIKIEPIPFKGASDALLALLRGEVDLGIEAYAAAVPHIKSGKFTALAVTSDRRSNLVPDLPSMGESKLSAATMEAFYGVVAPAATPAPILARLSREIAEIMAQPDVREKLTALNLEPSVTGAAEMTRTMQAETAKYRNAIARAGIKIEA